MGRFKRSLLIVLVNVAIMIAIVFGITLWFVPNFLDGVTDHSARVNVPAVANMMTDDAITVIEAQGLKPVVIDTIYSDWHKPGVVIEQLPEGNLPVKPGRIVYLTVNSSTVQKFAFPNVVDLSSRQAHSDLDDQYFIVDSVRYEAHEFDDLVLGVVSSTDGSPMIVGKEYPKRTRVVLIVGSTQLALEAENDENETAFFE